MDNSNKKKRYPNQQNPQIQPIVVTEEIKKILREEFGVSKVTIWAAITGREMSEKAKSIRARAAELMALAADRAEVEAKMDSHA